MYKYYNENKDKLNDANYYYVDCIFNATGCNSKGLLDGKNENPEFIKGVKQVVGHCKKYNKNKTEEKANEIKELKDTDGKTAVICADIGLTENNSDDGYKYKNNDISKLGLLHLNNKGITYEIQGTGIERMNKIVKPFLENEVAIEEMPMGEEELKEKDKEEVKSFDISILGERNKDFIKKDFFELNGNEQTKKQGFHIKFTALINGQTETFSYEMNNSETKLYKVEEKKGFTAKFSPAKRINEINDEGNYKGLQTEFEQKLKKLLNIKKESEIEYKYLESKYKECNSISLR